MSAAVLTWLINIAYILHYFSKYAIVTELGRPERSGRRRSDSSDAGCVRTGISGNLSASPRRSSRHQPTSVLIHHKQGSDPGRVSVGISRDDTGPLPEASPKPLCSSAPSKMYWMPCGIGGRGGGGGGPLLTTLTGLRPQRSCQKCGAASPLQRALGRGGQWLGMV